MYTHLDNLKEARFSTIPGGNREEVDFKGKTVYTSLTLKENIKKVIKKYAPYISQIINNLIDKEKLIPVFLSKNLLDYIKNRKRRNSHALGTTYKNKMYIFLDGHYSLLKLSGVNEKELVKTIIHEMIHFSSKLFPRKFLLINYKYYSIFYKEFFGNYLGIEPTNINNSIVLGLIKRQKEAEKKGIVNFVKLYIDVFNSLQKEANIRDNELEKLFDTFIDYLDTQYSKFSQNVPSEIWEAGRLAYMKLTGGYNKTLAQEFWNPEEIISIISEINPKHQAVIKSINLLKK